MEHKKIEINVVEDFASIKITFNEPDFRAYNFDILIEKLKSETFKEFLKLKNNCKSEAAESLGIKRTSFTEQLKRLGLFFRRVQNEE